MSTTTQQFVSAEEFLHLEEQKDLLRLVTAGSVDDGKSTLIGRLLYDSQSVYEDQIQAVKRASRDSLDLSLLTDGLRAEREQGITIDVAYRYFSTAQRKFILADTPGHEQYTRNMATGASNADLAILLIDASRGIQPQSKRHAFILGLLGIRHLAVVLNKMDLVGYSRSVFDRLQEELLNAIGELAFESVKFFPASAVTGDNVVHRSSRMPWFDEGTLLQYIESVDVNRRKQNGHFRLPVQRVERTSNFRGYSGQIAGGTAAVGDYVTVLPSLQRSRIKRLVTFDGELEIAATPQSVTLELEDELDISRGDVITSSEDLPFSAKSFHSQLIWFSEEGLLPGRRYLLKHTSETVHAEIVVDDRLDVSTLEYEPAGHLAMNDVAHVRIETAKPIFFDPYRHNRVTGSFILIDPDSNDTVAAGMIAAPAVDGPTGEQIRRGIIVDLTARKSLVEMVERRLASKGASQAVVLSHWNPKAAELLSAAGFHVFVRDVPEDVRNVRRLSQSDDREAVEELTRLLGSGGLLLGR